MAQTSPRNRSVRPQGALFFTVLALGTLVFLFLFAFPVRAANIDTFTHAEQMGVVLTHGDTVHRSDFELLTSQWTLHFNWPRIVPSSRGVIAIIRGTFGDIDSGTLVLGENYSVVSNSFSEGMNSISRSFFDLPEFGSTDAIGGTYTMLVAEAPSLDTQQDVLEWFASGGVSGIEPVDYTLLTFNYVAEDIAEELSDAITQVSYGTLTIPEEGEIFRDDISTPESHVWGFDFTWPDFVEPNRAQIYVFRGTEGSLEGGSAVLNDNYFLAPKGGFGLGFTFEQGDNNQTHRIQELAFRASTTDPSMITVLFVERDPKLQQANISLQAEADWFASGGDEGRPPKAYSFFTFDYKKYHDCCSSVVFLPGIKGSVLKTGSDTLWPPTVLSDDISQLALTEEGESVNPIIVDGILNTFYGTPIYERFSFFMDGLVTDGTIEEWLPLPYDWRYSPEKILTDGVITPGGTIDAIQKIKDLAENSNTGKVTLITHSMGGLLGKAIIKRLEEEGEEDLINSFVMVGTPQLGTPQAAASLLHGDGEGIAAGFIVLRSDVRAVAQNFQSSYNLLPSSKYFDEVVDPVIVFDEDAGFTEAWRNFWGTIINTYDDFVEFLTGTGIARTKPELNEIHLPEVLRNDLIVNANLFHQEFDNYEIPDSIRVVQVAGWGMSTLKGIEYRNRHFAPGYKALFTREGDKTVTYPSVVSSVADDNYFFNIFDYNDSLGVNVQHRDLLSAAPVQDLITSVMNNSAINEGQFMTVAKPDTAEIGEELLVSAHSPVVLGVYDEIDNFTGIDSNQDLSSDFLFITEDIPGSSFLTLGDSQYIFLPKEGSYTFVFRGIGEGPTTIEIEDFVNDTATLIVTYSDILVTSDTSATFIVDSSIPEETTIDVDTDGDGEINETILPDSEDDDEEELTPEELLEHFKETIKGFDIRRFLERNLIFRASLAQHFIEKDRIHIAKIIIRGMQFFIHRWTPRSIAEQSAEILLEILDDALKRL